MGEPARTGWCTPPSPHVKTEQESEHLLQRSLVSKCNENLTHRRWLRAHVPVMAFCCASVRVMDANLLGLARESSPVSPSAPSGSGDADNTMSVRLRLPRLMRSASSELPCDVRDALDCVMSSVILAYKNNQVNKWCKGFGVKRRFYIKDLHLGRDAMT